jgi:hypothetical protein
MSRLRRLRKASHAQRRSVPPPSTVLATGCSTCCPHPLTYPPEAPEGCSAVDGDPNPGEPLNLRDPGAVLGGRR